MSNLLSGGDGKRVIVQWADPTPARKGPFAVLSRPTDTYAEYRIRVDSRRLEISYLESVPRTEFGATTMGWTPPPLNGI